MDLLGADVGMRAQGARVSAPRPAGHGPAEPAEWDQKNGSSAGEWSDARTVLAARGGREWGREARAAGMKARLN